MKILITGILGFVGRHFTGYLSAVRGVEIFGLEKAPLSGRLPGAKVLKCDMMKEAEVNKVIRKIRPDIIFHLAAQSSVALSWEMPGETLTSNIISELNLFTAVVKAGINPVIQVAGSSDEYGEVQENELPVKEDNPLRPVSPYAVSKIAQDFLGYQYYKSHGLRIIRTRAFNASGPGRSEQYSTSSFAKQIAEIEAGKSPPRIYVGNLDVRRDFMDVRDVCGAYWILARKGKPGEVYNICSGTIVSIGEILKALLSLSKIQVEVVREKSRMRKVDCLIMTGDNRKLKALGWRQKISVRDSLLDLLNYWRKKI